MHLNEELVFIYIYIYSKKAFLKAISTMHPA